MKNNNIEKTILEKIHIDRIMIAAPASASGKTTVVCALLKVLKERGLNVVSYKCGPDYIDTMFHERAIGVPSKNLDTFFTDEAETKELFAAGAEGKDIAVLEGVMGLYDGLGGVREEGSSYHLAKVTKTPIILTVDAKGMGRSVIPLIAGFLDYDAEHLIKGVVLNRISKGYYDRLKPIIEEELNIKVAGFLPEREELRVGNRRLGLIVPHENDAVKESVKEKLNAMSRALAESVSVESIIKIAQDAGELDIDADSEFNDICVIKSAGDRPRIAVANDEAFCFYYADNILMLERYGAEIIYFSPLRDEKIPDGCHALLIGGGYPELYARRLSENIGMRESVKYAIENGMPVVAECGGFMYLHSAIIDSDGIRYDMADVIKGTCSDTGRTVRFGYIEIRDKRGLFMPEGDVIRGHEFHYYDSTDNGSDAVAVKPVTGKEYCCIIEDENRWMGFPHLYYPSNPVFAKRFVQKAEKYMKESK